MLKIYNSQTKQKEIFTPKVAGKINLYVCGLTVYDYCHVGNIRTFVPFDVIVRYLRFRGFHVNYVRNVTDIDDKIINRANEQHQTYLELANHFLAELRQDFTSLGMLVPDQEPRATEFVPQMIAMIERLIKNGYAYVGKNGDVYYHVKKFANYGQLSQRNLDEMLAGARVAVDEEKSDPLDFVLWKAAKPDEPSWDSPWGKGRPGWHIECSVMATKCLANTIDIHGGGKDLIFPHHENEIAQSEAATGEKFVNYWIHCGYLQVNQTKMSKSLGNFFTVREIFKKYPAEAIRYFIITSHYRSQLNYSEESLQNAVQALSRLYTALRGVKIIEDNQDNVFQQRFIEAMDDDFNTPEALTVLFDLAKEINRLNNNVGAGPGRDLSIQQRDIGKLAYWLKKLGGVFNLLQNDPEEFLQRHNSTEPVDKAKIEVLIAARNQARQAKDWRKSDLLRDELKALGVTLEDTAEGTTWRLL